MGKKEKPTAEPVVPQGPAGSGLSDVERRQSVEEENENNLKRAILESMKEEKRTHEGSDSRGVQELVEQYEKKLKEIVGTEQVRPVSVAQ